jgi:hypothetical protein
MLEDLGTKALILSVLTNSSLERLKERNNMFELIKLNFTKNHFLILDLLNL